MCLTKVKIWIKSNNKNIAVLSQLVLFCPHTDKHLAVLSKRTFDTQSIHIFGLVYYLSTSRFIISYVFNLERRKYVAVLFFISRKEFNVYQHDIHIFMNMIIWPLMTFTVTSFGVKLRFSRKKIYKLYLRVEKWSRSVFLHKSCWILLCRFRVESVNIFIS
jgi:hypothetical protein